MRPGSKITVLDVLTYYTGVVVQVPDDRGFGTMMISEVDGEPTDKHKKPVRFKEKDITDIS